MTNFAVDMSKLLKIAFVALLLGAMLCGCRPGAAEARLIAIDSLTATAPDSALSLLAATDTATLSEADRAYHALLTSQALYKAYIPATDSAAITRAWAYYRHHGPYDRRVRAMLHRGTTAEEMGLPDRAMLHYKEAEDYARPDDHYNRGYVLMHEGFLYQYQYTAADSAISKHSKALTQFRLCHDRHYQLVCLTELGMVYRLVDVDSALHFARNAASMAKKMEDSAMYYENMESMAGLYHKIGDWSRTKVYALDVINNGMASYLQSCYYYASQAYLHLGDMDSARVIFKLAPPPATARDSILYLRTLSLMEQQAKDYNSSMRHAEHAGDVASNAIWNKSKHDIKDAENQYVNQKLKADNSHLSGILLYVPLPIILLIVLAFYIGCRYLSFRHQVAHTYAILKATRQKLNKAIKQLESKVRETATESESRHGRIESNATDVHGLSDKAHEQVLPTHNEKTSELQRICLVTLLHSIVYSGSRGTSIFKYIFNIESEKNESIISVKLPDTFWRDLEQYVELAYPHAFEQIQLEGIQLSPKEKQFIYLDCLNAPNAAVVVTLGYAERSAASTRFKLAAKLGNPGQSFSDILHEKCILYNKSHF